jgi:formate hydrogenlyase subunit 3/multisubunit Na+/H+ antiporter MnhD subunit
MAWLLLVTWVWPLVLALTLLPPLWRPGSRRPEPERLPGRTAALAVLGPLPALAAGLLVPIGTTLSLPWLFLDTTLILDATTRVFLLFTAVIWLVAGLEAAVRMRAPDDGLRFHLPFLLAMAGNLWLIVALDLASFYVGFAVMGLAAYGLVVYDRTPAARRAGRVYLALTLFGEVCLFAALLMVAQQAGTTLPSADESADLPGAAVALILIAFGIKAGLVPLHLWLPISYAAAPTAAAAVLSGAMSKAALLGWMRFLPLGVAALPEWGAVLAGLGVLSMFYALPVGLVQADPKALLGYSSIGKMGLIALVLGMILIDPGLAPLGLPALVLLAAHHGLVKAGLFLGLARRIDAPGPGLGSLAVLLGLVLLAAALAGAPLTSGGLAKYELKPVLSAAPWPWVAAAALVSTVGVTLLMARFLWIAVGLGARQAATGRWSAPRSARLPSLGWGLLLGLVLVLPFVLGSPSAWSTNLIPVGLGSLFGAAVWLGARANPSWLRDVIGLFPPGDLVVGVRRAVAALAAALTGLIPVVGRLGATLSTPMLHALDRLLARTGDPLDQGLRDWRVAGALWVGLTLVLVVLLAGPWLGAPALGATTG